MTDIQEKFENIYQEVQDQCMSTILTRDGRGHHGNQRNESDWSFAQKDHEGVN